jgi:uncharacterized protein
MVTFKNMFMSRLFFFLCLLPTQYLLAQNGQPDSVVKKDLVLAKRYLDGAGGQAKNEAAAFTLIQKHAAAGVAEAMNMAGICYNEGLGVAKNRKTAIDWLVQSGRLNYAQAWYNLGMLYRTAQNEDERDFSKAYAAFAKAAELGDPQSKYAVGYMLYKGMGCAQNYPKAFHLFLEGAKTGKPNSMYFLGLCYRNGYGISQNTDSARYWLMRAAFKGYKMAASELQIKTAENSNAEAKALATTLFADYELEQNNLNQYRKVQHSLPAAKINGVYEGYIIRYDWSGQHAINWSRLTLTLRCEGKEMIGQWSQPDSVEIPVFASLTRHALLFKNTSFKRTDHYSPNKAINYQFTNAKLKWQVKDDTVRIHGNLQMFSTDRNEPEKPIFIALKKVAEGDADGSVLDIVNDDGSKINITEDLAVYPNPFEASLMVEFKLKSEAQVQTDLLTAEGRVVYSNHAGKLSPGNYLLELKPKELAAGTYFVRLQAGKELRTTKVIKQ